MTKKIEAIISQEKLGVVKEALRAVGIIGMNVMEIRGRGRHGSGNGEGQETDLLPKVQINIVLSDHNVEKTIMTIRQAVNGDEAADGIIFILPVEDVIRIRSGERGRAALMYPHDIDERQA